jgi:putative toxin-antitoxin system antitoxin component (TIGR02293 family)
MERAARKPVPKRKATAAKRVVPVRTAAGKAATMKIAGGSNVVTWYVDRIARATPVEVIELEREGVPGTLVKELSARIHVSRQRMYEIIGAPKATVERKASTNALVTGTAGQAALGVVRLLAQARGMLARSTAPEAKGFDVERWLGRWIETPQPALGGKKPADFLDTPTGQAIVERTLGAIESGAYL